MKIPNKDFGLDFVDFQIQKYHQIFFRIFEWILLTLSGFRKVFSGFCIDFEKSSQFSFSVEVICILKKHQGFELDFEVSLRILEFGTIKLCEILNEC